LSSRSVEEAQGAAGNRHSKVTRWHFCKSGWMGDCSSATRHGEGIHVSESRRQDRCQQHHRHATTLRNVPARAGGTPVSLDRRSAAKPGQCYFSKSQPRTTAHVRCRRHTLTRLSLSHKKAQKAQKNFRSREDLSISQCRGDHFTGDLGKI